MTRSHPRDVRALRLLVGALFAFLLLVHTAACQAAPPSTGISAGEVTVSQGSPGHELRCEPDPVFSAAGSMARPFLPSPPCLPASPTSDVAVWASGIEVPASGSPPRDGAPGSNIGRSTLLDHGIARN